LLQRYLLQLIEEMVNKSNSICTVDLNAISNNVDALQSRCRPGVQQMAVVKADAYGHGAVKVAKKVAPQVGWFAVNDIYEAIELRDNGIQKPILVFGVPAEGEAHLYRKHEITATVSSSHHFTVLPEGTEYHLNFDTGMNRLGFRAEQSDEVIELKNNHPELKCTGIYSHFATADEPGSKKINQQLELFKQIRKRFDSSLLTHLCNTAGLIQCPEAQFDLVRTGIGIYGYSPGQVELPELKPAISWETHLVQVKPIKKSETVSYGAGWTAKEDGFIGVIPVGYADGIPRSLSGDIEVSINGKNYPMAGTITMNYCMIDLGKKQFKTGTEVYLWNQHHTAKEWADKMDTIPYEILTNLPRAVQREYNDSQN